jgi:glutathione S-transferase
MKLYELAAQEDDRCFSPYCWRARMALAHKDLSCETIPLRFTEKAEIAFSGQERVPVLVDGEKTISDSWTIAKYLEAAYPDRPSLFGSADALALTHFVNAWTDRVLHAAITPLVVTDILAHIPEKDRDYFRKSREQRFGKSLEEVASDRDRRVLDLREALEPFRAIVRERTYLSGDRPMYADYIFFGAFQWARCISPFRLLDDGDPVAAWRDRMLYLYDGMGLRAKGYPV